MVSINYSSREVCCKIVYYGPGLSGKTTNLLYVHSKVPSNTRGKMISLATEADRTLYFDFLPINIGTINGFAAKFQLYTVPGQVYYNATRKLVLRGVDGVVFVADSQPDKMDENIESLLNLEENLQEYGYNLEELPMVIQYNKRDLPGVLSLEQLNAKLNVKGRPFYEASATLGNGVFDTLKMIIKMVLEKAKSNSRSKPKPVTATPVAPPTSFTSEAINKPVSESAPKSPEPSSATLSREHVLASAPSTPVSTPSEKVGAVASAAVPKVKEEQSIGGSSAEVNYRPYPGSEKQQAKEVDTPKTSFTSQSQEYGDNNTVEEKQTGQEIDNSEFKQPDLSLPKVIPAMKHRHEKKRGFFKRLFGIK
ncbi:MAG: GTPase [FCB group bacterium]|nr:GTPase [FCB group bacterium]